MEGLLKALLPVQPAPEKTSLSTQEKKGRERERKRERGGGENKSA
jgi:hypothetical protein